jgi:hypothetical protein
MRFVNIYYAYVRNHNYNGGHDSITLEPKTDDLIRKNKRGKYLLDDSEINQDLIT